MNASAIELFLLALALAVDAAAVTAGLATGGASRRDLVAASTTFGVFQAALAGLGAVGGAWLVTIAAAWDHWIAFGLLAIVGGRMLVPGGDDDDEVDAARLALGRLVVLAIATSIDALAAGVGLPLLEVPYGVSIVTVGLVTWVLCGIAAQLGTRFSGHLGQRAEQIGGVVLIGLGIKILVEHLTQG